MSFLYSHLHFNYFITYIANHIICVSNETIMSFSASLHTIIILSEETLFTMFLANSISKLRCFIYIAGPQLEYISKPRSAAFVTPTRYTRAS